MGKNYSNIHNLNKNICRYSLLNAQFSITFSCLRTHKKTKTAVGVSSILRINAAMYCDHLISYPTDTIRWINVGLTLVQRRRRWTNVKPTLIPRTYVASQPYWLIRAALVDSRPHLSGVAYRDIIRPWQTTSPEVKHPTSAQRRAKVSDVDPVVEVRAALSQGRGLERTCSHVIFGVLINAAPCTDHGEGHIKVTCNRSVWWNQPLWTMEWNSSHHKARYTNCPTW